MMDKGTLRLMVMLCVVDALMGTSAFFFNGSLNMGDVVDSQRDWATLAQIVAAACLALVARYAPRAVNFTAVSAACALAVPAGVLLAWWGSIQQLATPLIIGACLAALVRLWESIVFLVLLSRLRLWQMAIVLALGSALSVPLAWLVSLGGYAVTAVVDAVFTLAVLGFIFWQARGEFRTFACAEPAVDAALTAPRSVLPLSHDLFVYTFLFCTAYGFGLRYEHADGGLLLNGVLAAVFLGIVAHVLMRRLSFRVDVLFNVAFILVMVGFLLVLVDEPFLVWHASVALTASSEVFSLLMCLALAAVAARSKAGALSTVAWGYAVYYAGIEAGAQLGIFATGLGTEGHFLAKCLVAAMFAVICVYTLYSIRDFGFDKTIEGVQETAVIPADLGQMDDSALAGAGYDAGIERRCRELAASYGLTEREGEVFALLARGKNATRVSEELAITKNTLKYHVRHIYEKCGIHSQQELIDLL